METKRMTEYQQYLENKKKYGEFETEKQFWINQKEIAKLQRHVPDHHKEWSLEHGDRCREDCPRCVLDNLKENTECPF